MIQINTSNMLSMVSLKWSGFILVVANSIKEHVPSADVRFNMVPKQHAMSDIYCQLVPNDDDNNPFYEVVPRIGSFEVSLNGVVSTNFFTNPVNVSVTLFKNALRMLAKLRRTRWKMQRSCSLTRQGRRHLSVLDYRPSKEGKS